MTLRDILAAIRPGVLLLSVLAAGGIAAIALSIALADHTAIRKAIAEAPLMERGVPVIDQRRHDFVEGFFPDCAGLSQLLREDGAHGALGAAIRAETIIPPSSRTICEELDTALSDPDAVSWFTYARYWHGSLLLHRAVLSVASYDVLQTISLLIVVLAALWLAIELARRFSWTVSVALALPFVMLTDTIAVSAVPMQAVALSALFGACALFTRVGAGLSGAAALVAAGGAGAAYNFFDFFWNPETLAAFCAWCWAAAALARGERVRARDVALIFLAALGGYGGMWAMKWLIAFGYGFVGGYVYLFNSGDLSRWTAGGATFWAPGLPSVVVIAQAFESGWKLAIGVAISGAALVLRRAPMPAVLVVAPLLGFAVLEIFTAHTIVHPAATFRLVPLALGLFAASAMLSRQIAPAARSSAIPSEV